jgi:hypothetical protein
MRAVVPTCWRPTNELTTTVVSTDLVKRKSRRVEGRSAAVKRSFMRPLTVMGLLSSP